MHRCGQQEEEEQRWWTMVRNSTGSWTVVAVLALDLFQRMNSDLVPCSQVGRSLHDVEGVASPHSWVMPALIDEILNLACESELFLPSLCQPL